MLAQAFMPGKGSSASGSPGGTTESAGRRTRTYGHLLSSGISFILVSRPARLKADHSRIVEVSIALDVRLNRPDTRYRLARQRHRYQLAVPAEEEDRPLALAGAVLDRSHERDLAIVIDRGAQAVAAGREGQIVHRRHSLRGHDTHLAGLVVPSVSIAGGALGRERDVALLVHIHLPGEAEAAGPLPAGRVLASHGDRNELTVTVLEEHLAASRVLGDEGDLAAVIERADPEVGV